MVDLTLDLTIDGSTVNNLLKSKISELDELEAIYSRLPDTQCLRKTRCCSMLPEATLLEVLAVFKRLGSMPEGQRRGIFARIIEYFFINPARITACPFLAETRCTIYEDRFFGCRAYGLWSTQHYNQMAGYNRKAKLSLERQWRKMGIALPDDVLDFQVPYCLDVEVLSDAVVGDSGLMQISHEIADLSARLSPWHGIFNQQYVADLSFLTATIAYGIQSALRTKVDIVRQLVSTVNRTRLDQILIDLEGKPLPFLTNRKNQL
jgi:Fe-S-cluster containining protein